MTVGGHVVIIMMADTPAWIIMLIIWGAVRPRNWEECLSRKPMLRFGGIVTLLLAAVLALSATPAAASQQVAIGPAFLTSVNSNRCVNVRGASMQIGAPIIQYDCLFAPNNLWTLVGPNDTGPYQIVSKNSNLCLNVQGASKLRGANIIQYSCVDAPNNLWELRDPNNDGVYEIVSVNSGLCLNVDHASLANGAAIIQYDCSTAANNLWRVVTG